MGNTHFMMFKLSLNFAKKHVWYAIGKDSLYFYKSYSFSGVQIAILLDTHVFDNEIYYIFSGLKEWTIINFVDSNFSAFFEPCIIKKTQRDCCS